MVTGLAGVKRTSRCSLRIPAGVASWAARAGPAAATVIPTPAALTAAPARNAVRRLMGAFVLGDRSGVIIVLLGETSVAMEQPWFLLESLPKASPPCDP